MQLRISISFCHILPIPSGTYHIRFDAIQSNGWVDWSSWACLAELVDEGCQNLFGAIAQGYLICFVMKLFTLCESRRGRWRLGSWGALGELLAGLGGSWGAPGESWEGSGEVPGGSWEPLLHL